MCLDEFYLTIPQFYLDIVLPSQSLWEEAVIDEIHCSQFLIDGLRVSEPIGRILFDGLASEDGILIVPERLLDDVPVDHTFDFGR